MTLPPAMLRAMVRVSGGLPGNHPLRQRTAQAISDGDPVGPNVPPPGRVWRDGRGWQATAAQPGPVFVNGVEMNAPVFVNGVEMNAPPAPPRAVGVAVRPQDGRVGGKACCAVCLNDYAADDDCVVLPCGHGFHRACIMRWVGTNPSCPLCRTRV